MLITTTISTQATEPTRDELRRRQREAFAMRSGWPELNRSDLTFARYSVTHEPTGDQYQIFKGEINSAIGTTYPCRRVLLRRQRRHPVPRTPARWQTMTHYEYVAQLIPIRKPLNVVDRTHGLITEWFDEHCFALERKHPDRVAVLLDHDTTRIAGWLDSLLVLRGWLTGTFHLDLNSNAGAVAHDYIQCGTPVSVGFNPELTNELGHGIRHHQIAKLNEVSIIRTGIAAYQGAQVTRRMELPQRAKPAEKGEVIWGGPDLRRHFETPITVR